MHRARKLFSIASACGCAVVLAGSVVSAAWGQSRVRETTIAIGDGWGLVRELRQIDLRRGEQDLMLDGIPAEADLSTLIIRSRRAEVELLSWERPHGASPDTVHCRIRSAVAVPRAGIDVIYRIQGLRWAAEYEIVVRGEGEDERAPVSADLRGILRIGNNTSRVFSNAVVRIEHREGMSEAEKSMGPGFLMLDRSSPLSDLWFDAPGQPLIPYSFEVPARINLQPYSEVMAPLISKTRVPAWRFYSMASEKFPSDAREFEALNKMIAFRHDDDLLGPAVMLPPGNVRIYLGALRRHFVQEAFFQRTSPGEEIRVDLGPVDDVVGRRITGSRQTLPGSIKTESHEIHLQNRRDAGIRLEIDETPPVNLGWSLISSTLPCRQVSKRLLFSTSVAAGESAVIGYQLRIYEPEI